MQDESKAVGIKSIAKALKVSIGTVDRALHGRPGVSEKTKTRILQMADQLGYKPNLAAKALKLNRRLAIGVVLPKHISHFFDPLRAGIREAAAAAMGMQVSLEFHEYPRLGVGDVQAIEAALERRYDGIIFLPGDARKFDPLIRKLSRSGTAMMCVGSDAPNTERVGSVSAHAYVSGAIAADSWHTSSLAKPTLLYSVANSSRSITQKSFVGLRLRWPCRRRTSLSCRRWKATKGQRKPISRQSL